MKTINNIDIGKKIQMRRRELKITQEQLAEICDISTSYIGHIERGSRSLTLNTAVKICSALEIGLDALLLDCAESENEIINCINSALKSGTEEQRKKFLSTIKILAQNINNI